MDNTFVQKIVKALGYNVTFNEGDDADSAILSPIESEAPALPESLEGVNARELKATVLLAQNAASEVKALRDQLGGEDGLKNLIVTLNDIKAYMQTAQAEQDRERDGLVAQIVKNTSVYSEDELKAKPVGELKKINALMALPEVDYSFTNAGMTQNAESLALPPAVFFAKREVK